MKRFTSYRKQLLLALMCLLGLTVSAQTETPATYSATVTDEASVNYSGLVANFSLTDVASKLNTDTCTLYNALLSAREDNTYLVYSAAKSDYVSGCNGDGVMYWLDGKCEISDWGADGEFYIALLGDTAKNTLSVQLGHKENKCDDGAEYNPRIKFVLGDKFVTFDIKYIVNKLFVAPDPSTIFVSKLNVTESQSVSVSRIVTDDSYSTVKFAAKPVADALGLSSLADLNSVISKRLYCQAIDELGVLSDSLTNESTAGVPGFWLKNTVYAQGTEKQGEASGLLGVSTWGDATSVIYAEQVQVDEDSISVFVGQKAGVFKEGDDFTLDYYLINGDKAYKLSINVKGVGAGTDLISEYTHVESGDQNFTINVSTEEADYQNHKFTVDLEAIAAALGCSASDLTVKAQKNDDEFYIGSNTCDPKTAGYKGFYYDTDGYVCSWGTNAAGFAVNASEGDYSIFTCGLYAGRQKEDGKTYNAKLYFVNGTSYSIVNIDFVIATPTTVEDQHDWVLKGERSFSSYVVIPSVAYTPTYTDALLPASEVTSLLGTSSYAMYVDLHDTLKTDTKLYAQKDRYNCAPVSSTAVGAWLGEMGQGCAWGSSAYVGLCYDIAKGNFEIFEMTVDEAGTTRVKAGDSWNCSIYLVNEDATPKEYVKVNMNINFVADSADIKKTEVVGSQTITAVLDESNIYSVDLNLAPVAELLGLKVEDFASEEKSYLYGMLANGQWANASAVNNGAETYSLKGVLDTDGQGKMFVALGDVSSDGNVTLTIAIPNVEEDFDANSFTSSLAFGIKNDGKVYVYYVNISTAAGIDNIVAASSKSGKIYNISGQRVSKAHKGLYIVNGKKFVK